MFGYRGSSLAVLGVLLLCPMQGCVFSDAVTTADCRAPGVAITSPEDGAVLDPLMDNYDNYLSVTARDEQLSSLTIFCNDSLYTSTQSSSIHEKLDVAGLAARYDSVSIKAVARDEVGNEAVHCVRIRFFEVTGPTPMGPRNGTTILRGAGETLLTLTIVPPPRIDSYFDWQVARDSTFSAPVEYVTSRYSTTTLTLDVPMTEAGRFYWRVRGRATTGAVTSWSPVWSYNIFLGTAACSLTFTTFTSIDRIVPSAGSAFFYALGQDGSGVSLGMVDAACSVSWQTPLAAVSSYIRRDACALPDGRLVVSGNGGDYSSDPQLFVFDPTGGSSGPFNVESSQGIVAVRRAADGGYFCGFLPKEYLGATPQDFLIKIDSLAGQVQWRIPATAGSCARLATSDDDTCCLYLGKLGQQDFSVGKVTISGRTLWTRAFNLVGRTDKERMALCALPDGGCVFGGALFHYDNYDGEIFIARLDADGAIRWQSSFSTSWREGWSLAALALLPDGSLLCAGGLVVDGDADIALLKVSSAGQLLWSRTYGSPGRQEYAADIALQGDTVVLSGYRGSNDQQGLMLKMNLDGDILVDD